MAAAKKQKEPGASRRKTEPLAARIAPYPAAALSGALLTLCFSPIDAHLLAWFALVPFMWAVCRTTPRGAMLCGYIFGVAYLSLLLWWISVVRYPAVIGYAAGSLILPVIFIPWAWFANRAMNRWPAAAPWILSCLWVTLEWIMSQGTFAFPWWILGNTQARNLVTAQAASLGGVNLVSFEVMMVNFFLLAAAGGRWPREKIYWAPAGAFIIALQLYGIACLAPGPDTDRSVSLALLQPSYSQDEKEDPDAYKSIYPDHIKMTREAVREHHPDMVVWSESVTYLGNLADPEMLPYIKDMLNMLDTMLVAGVYEFEDEQQYNAVVVIDPEEGVVGKYRKMQLVPFGEMFPYRKQIESISPAIGDWIRNEVYPFDIAAGKELEIFDTRHGKFSAMICFESVIPNIAREMTLMGAEYLFVVTNDAWFKKTPGVHQHASLGAYRAIETRRYVVQAANSGVSFIADPWGRMLVESEVFKKEILCGEIEPKRSISLYTRFGDWFCYLCMGVLAVFFASRLFRRRGAAG